MCLGTNESLIFIIIIIIIIIIIVIIATVFFHFTVLCEKLICTAHKSRYFTNFQYENLQEIAEQVRASHVLESFHVEIKH